ncbi:hypothetical protein F6476_13255 [Pseudomonas umsongensis]|uniref:hypothetical protein n=1 Tax=Pseudomonas umsongensis TaxID=198618 RepID=UPI00124566B0|nr:hypothetical protein [Pseudomonas umsongensis]QFG30092.1 hypothetical protein F6476_13255 [Pseudomonas umsongensis]
MALKVRKMGAGSVGAALMISLAGCMGPEFRILQVAAYPEGATIRDDAGKVTPKISYIEVPYRSSELKKNMENGCFLISGYNATWPSGAKGSTGLIRWCNTQYPQMRVNIDRPKDAPNLSLDNKLDVERAARQQAEYEESQRHQLEAMNNRPKYQPAEEDSEDDSDSDDGDIGMAGALSIIANSYASTRTSAQRNTNNHVAPASMTSVQKQSQLANMQRALAANPGYESTTANTASRDSGSGHFDYDTSHPQCVTYGRHPTLNVYAQYKNTCPYDVSVTYCGVLKNGRDNCASRIFGSFELKSGGTNIAEGSDASVKYIVCKLPYRAIGSEVSISGDQLSAPCQKNK